MSLIYRIPGKSTFATYNGRTEFGQCSLPRPSKSEYGLDSMVVDYIGAAPLLKDFLASIKQGKRMDINQRQWWVTTYAPDDNKLWPTVTLNCVGLAEGELPDPKGDDDYITQNITVTGTVTEDDEDVQVTREINYRALQTTWTYPTKGRPKGPVVKTVSRNFFPEIISSVIEANGKRYAGANAPGNYVAATTPALVDFIMDVSAQEIFGTPFFNVSEVVCRMFLAG